jgi:O-antigen/teichoic acid export membrane protein
LYAPEAFGTAAVFASIANIIIVVSCMRYERSIMLPETDEEASNLLLGSVGIVCLVSALTGLGLWLGRQPLLHWLNAPALAAYLWLLPLAVFARGVSLAFQFWNSRTKHFGRLSATRVIGAVSTAGPKLAAGFAGHATGGSLIGANVIGSTAAAAVLGGQTWRDDRRLFRGSASPRKILDSLKRYRKFPLVDSWGALANSVSLQLPPLMLAAFFSQTTVGYFSVGSRLIMLPSALIGGATAQVFFQRASAIRSQQDGLARTVEAVFRGLVALGLFPCLLLMIVGEDVFVVVLGQNWAEAGIYVQILSPWIFAAFISSPLSALFTVLERQELALVVHVSILVTRLIALAVGGMLGNVYLALGLFSASGVLVYGGLVVWNMELAGVSVQAAFRILLHYALYSTPALVVLVVLKVWFEAGPPLMLVVSALAALAYYSLLLRQDTFLRSRFASVLQALVRK